MLLYAGTVVLGMNEKDFWRCTPRKFFALCDVHRKMHGTSEQEETQTGFIDQVLF
ncbi:hypothetical protein [Geobacillus vulcani]|uniref:hypothetical protein n=1 Tax=Geobacillus vulcani TaxID=135517 RepID=UPI0009FC57F3